MIILFRGAKMKGLTECCNTLMYELKKYEDELDTSGAIVCNHVDNKDISPACCRASSFIIYLSLSSIAAITGLNGASQSQTKRLLS